MFGDVLVGRDGTEHDTKTALAGKTVGIYFSAHWCPPCRQFTPSFARAYEQLTGEMGKDFEVVFVSSDRDEAAFDEYRGEMPWLALPFSARDVKAKLSATFKVNGIPALVVLDETGATVTTDGRRAALDKLLPEQRSDFVTIFEVMAGLPCTIRLLDPPLHELLNEEEIDMYSKLNAHDRVMLASSLLVDEFAKGATIPHTVRWFAAHVEDASAAWKGCCRIRDNDVPFSFGHLYHLMLFVTFVFGTPIAIMCNKRTEMWGLGLCAFAPSFSSRSTCSPSRAAAPRGLRQ